MNSLAKLLHSVLTAVFDLCTAVFLFEDVGNKETDFRNRDFESVLTEDFPDRATV